MFQSDDINLEWAINCKLQCQTFPKSIYSKQDAEHSPFQYIQKNYNVSPS
jgi:hypothetical protein